MKIDLKYPIKTGEGKTVSSLELRRAKVADLRAASRGSDSQEDQEVALLASLSGLLPEDVLELDLADYKALQDAFRGMLD